ncbi:MAG TPA: MGMT family protein [archaeon]|nr:MGMT family protein [archaeon]
MNAKGEKVYRLLLKVPKGKVTTYGAVARALGSKSLARFVGTCMRKNSHPETFPCYKVVRSDGRVGEYTHPLGAGEKIRRLERDGVRVENGRIDLKEFLYEF